MVALLIVTLLERSVLLSDIFNNKLTAKARHEQHYKLGCCIYTFNILSCQIITCLDFLDIICYLVKHDIKASFYHHGALISRDPPSFPVIFFFITSSLLKGSKKL